ncbi:MAG: reverse transcriptase domain-containing protein [Sedimenticola sp.]
MNVRGLGAKSKRTQIFQWFKDNSYDICFLQETHTTLNTANEWESEWGSDAIFSGNSSNSEGVGILFNSRLAYTIHSIMDVIPGRIQAVNLEINNKNTLLINIYGPNTEGNTFFNQLDDFISQHENERMIIGGDFNVTLNCDLDKKGGLITTNKVNRDKIKNIIEKYDLSDIWRIQHGNQQRFTWHSNSTPRVLCRLDYFLVSDNLVNTIKKSEIKSSMKTDHALVKLTININNQPRGPGYFKLNNSVLFDDEYKHIIKNSISEIAEINKEANPNILWEVIKGTIRNESIKYCARKNRKDKLEEVKLQEKIDELVKANIDTPEAIDEINNHKKRLEDIYEKRAEGIIFRSKVNWVEGGEKNTNFFADLEKRKFDRKIISELNVNGQKITDKDKILEEQKRFYQNLYKKKENIESEINFFPEDYDKKLNEEEKIKCEGVLSEPECFNALKEMNNNKSPGTDGITTEFYKLFWNEIKTYLIKSLNYSLEIGELTVLQKQSVINLIPKKGKDGTNLANWRPISLLNIDYKIATKTIANRIKSVLNNLIDSSQTGFIKGRYIGENIRLLFETIDFVNENQIPGLLFFADFEKAFDSVSHEYIMKVLRFLNFGPSLIKWVEVFYHNISSRVTNNGYLTDFFGLGRGVRQGCPLSPYLFILAIELLSHSVRNNNRIKGIIINQEEIKNTMFADDATFCLDGSKESLEALINTIDNFGYISGLRLNYSKSIIFKTGSLKTTKLTFCEDKKFEWTADVAKTLGINFCNDKNRIHDINLLPKLNEFKQCLDRWKRRKLTTIGKITVLKSFAFPKLIFPLTVLDTPGADIIKQITHIMFDFLWDSKPDKVSRKVIVQNFENGGLKMIDPECFINSLKASWVKRLTSDTNNGQWKSVYTKYLHKFGGTNIFEGNFHQSDAKLLIKNVFLSNIVGAWAKLNYSENPENISKQILWNNSNMKGNGSTFYYKDWDERGIKYIEHIYDYRTKTFFEFTYIKQLYNVSNSDYLKYFKMISTIPQTWRARLRNETINTQNNTIPLLTKVQSSKQCNKMLYTIFLSKITNVVFKARTKWIAEFSEKEINWRIVNTQYFRSTISTKLRNFQYKCLMRIIATNVHLYKCGIVNSNLCDLCSMAPETYKHLFWECQKSQFFWSELNTFLQDNNINFTLDWQLISLGQYETEHIFLNFCIILGKYFIYGCKLGNNEPTFAAFKVYLNKTKIIEYQLAMNRNKVDVHNKKWNGVPLD